ncbi:cytochrome oxidase small assembly protein [Polynucleobacter sp. AP-Nickl1-40-C4]|uniref:cytochrome oxidase small assembly protein n=1 Tax=Polynucleobacter sp. AP-Nickl1-40-C4 TaxID=3108275 RepID=UPI002B23B57F|nr:cytochrome oxidase small assembly protein [Polynucleobacter sp. AP-Nickl1-40-C4]MEA9567894.1 cytochrome oxidase small assembly protein [Polynucleobacter sp. AP-Nickl1-40-C4]
MELKVWSGLFLLQRHITLLKLRLVQSKCVKQEFKSSEKQVLAANNRRMGFILLSVVLVFFIGIVIKRSMLG